MVQKITVEIDNVTSLQNEQSTNVFLFIPSYTAGYTVYRFGGFKSSSGVDGIRLFVGTDASETSPDNIDLDFGLTSSLPDDYPADFKQSKTGTADITESDGSSDGWTGFKLDGEASSTSGDLVTVVATREVSDQDEIFALATKGVSLLGAAQLTRFEVPSSGGPLSGKEKIPGVTLGWNGYL